MRRADLAQHAQDDLRRLRPALAESGAVSAEELAHARAAVSQAQAAVKAAFGGRIFGACGFGRSGFFARTAGGSDGNRQVERCVVEPMPADANPAAALQADGQVAKRSVEARAAGGGEQHAADGGGAAVGCVGGC